MNLFPSSVLNRTKGNTLLYFSCSGTSNTKPQHQNGLTWYHTSGSFSHLFAQWKQQFLHIQTSVTRDSSNLKSTLYKTIWVPTKILCCSCRCRRKRSGYRCGRCYDSRRILNLAWLLDALPFTSVVIHLKVSLNCCRHECVIWLWYDFLVLTEFYCYNVTQMWAWVICNEHFMILYK